MDRWSTRRGRFTFMGARAFGISTSSKPVTIQSADKAKVLDGSVGLAEPGGGRSGHTFRAPSRIGLK